MRNRLQIGLRMMIQIRIYKFNHFSVVKNYYQLNFVSYPFESDQRYHIFIYPFLNNLYVLKFKYFLFDTNIVKRNININKLIIIKVIRIGKNQSILKKFVTKKQENITENIREKIIIGTNNIRDSNIVIIKIFDFSKPKILKTRF